MQVFFGIAYLAIGLIQLVAVIDGIKYATGLGSILSAVLSIFVNYVPLLGSVLGVYGAIKVWDWNIIQAGCLFFWYVPVFLLMTAASVVFSRR